MAINITFNAFCFNEFSCKIISDQIPFQFKILLQICIKILPLSLFLVRSMSDHLVKKVKCNRASPFSLNIGMEEILLKWNTFLTMVGKTDSHSATDEKGDPLISSEVGDCCNKKVRSELLTVYYKIYFCANKCVSKLIHF